MQPSSGRRRRWIATLTLAIGASACDGRALSSRADRRLDTAESRFDSLEARVERLERADSVRAADSDTDIEAEINREYRRIHPAHEPDGWLQLLNLDHQLVLDELRKLPDGAGEEAARAAVEAALQRQYPGIEPG